MTPLDYYQEQCRQGIVLEDAQQLMALQYLQALYHELVSEQKKRNSLFAFLRPAKSVQGLYLWGGVGIGKTFLMDCFYHCLPMAQKKRVHFHQFMRFVHAELKKYQGKKDPLQHIAKALAKETRILCFDELLVTDITDAMLLGRLLRALFSQGVCLVATSNVAPDDLYKNGLQRPLFLPAIAMLKKHMHVISLTTTADYRLRHLQHAGVYFTPDDEIADEEMEKCFALLSQGETYLQEPIEICGRRITIKKQAGDMVWFDFDKICAVPRSQHDYLAIAEKYSTILISHIPIIPSQAKDTISLFIRMVDVFYDARVRLVISAAASVDKLYEHGYLAFDFARTRSRLLEMQSQAYFMRERGDT